MPQDKWRDERGQEDRYGQPGQHHRQGEQQERYGRRGYEQDDGRSFSQNHDASDRYRSGGSGAGGHDQDRRYGAGQGDRGYRGEGDYGASGEDNGRYRSSGYGDARSGGAGGSSEGYRPYGGQRPYESAGTDWRGGGSAQRRESGMAGEGGRWTGEGMERSDRFRGGHFGRGPRGYTRSDDRIREDVNDCLTDDWQLDATSIEVAVSGCEVTLTGTVGSREEKRRAEDIVENVSGVKHVQNNLRVQQSDTTGMYPGAAESGTSGASTTAANKAGRGRSST